MRLPSEEIWHPNEIKGSFEGNRYYDASGAFSIEIPKNHQTRILEYELSSPQHFGVTFEAPICRLIHVEVCILSDEFLAELFLSNSCEYAIEKLLFDGFIEPIMKDFPEIKAHGKRWIELDDGSRAFYTLVDIPNALIYQCANTEEHFDAYKSCLFFFADNQLVILSYQLPPICTLTGRSEREDSRALELLLNLQKSYQNESEKHANIDAEERQ
ncbi:MAG: hypothetical protein Q8K75_06485 [Chlamydiales bacterium]|nr:hypothetical protein [Chlamydiales bacterium]